MGRGDQSTEVLEAPAASLRSSTATTDAQRDAVLQEMVELNDLLTKHSAIYYEQASFPDLQPISDAEYDEIERRLEQLKAENEDLVSDLLDIAPDASEMVGSAATSAGFEKVSHEYPMLSLDKVHTEDDLKKWMAKYPDQEMDCWFKFDGVSLDLRYEKGELVRAATRGDGAIGDVITENARRINGVRAKLDQAITAHVRGEVIMKKSDWRAYNERNPDKPFANPRNAVSGSIRQKSADEVAKRPMTFIAYELVIVEGDLSSDRVSEQLQELGYETLSHSTASTPKEILDYLQNTQDQRDSLDFDIDGAVFRVADRAVFDAAGSSSRAPRAAIAMKLAAEIGESSLLGVDWQVGKSGEIAPVGRIAPLFLAGTTIQKVTLHNMEIIKQRGVRIGDRIKLKRAGDVIPHVLGKADTYERDGSETDITPPAKCPSCGEPTESDDSGFTFCRNTQNCPAQQHRRLVQWGNRDSADIDALGQSWLEKFADAGLVKRPSDLYYLTKADIENLEGMGQRMPDKLLESIEGSKDVGLRRALIGMSIPEASKGTAKRLCRNGYDSIEEVAAATEEQLCEVEDIGPVVAHNIHTYLNSPKMKEEIKRLRAAGVNLDTKDEDKGPKASEVSAAAAGKKFCVTGTLEGVSRKEMEAKIEAAGGKASSSVSKNTDYLIAGENAGSKLAKAEGLGVKVLSQAEALTLLG